MLDNKHTHISKTAPASSISFSFRFVSFRFVCLSLIIYFILLDFIRCSLISYWCCMCVLDKINCIRTNTTPIIQYYPRSLNYSQGYRPRRPLSIFFTPNQIESHYHFVQSAPIFFYSNLDVDKEQFSQAECWHKTQHCQREYQNACFNFHPQIVRIKRRHHQRDKTHTPKMSEEEMSERKKRAQQRQRHRRWLHSCYVHTHQHDYLVEQQVI